MAREPYPNVNHTAAIITPQASFVKKEPSSSSPSATNASVFNITSRSIIPRLLLPPCSNFRLSRRSLRLPPPMLRSVGAPIVKRNLHLSVVCPAYAVICALAMYALWVRKPLDSQDPTMVEATQSVIDRLSLSRRKGGVRQLQLPLGSRVRNIEFRLEGGYGVEIVLILGFLCAVYGGIHLSAWNFHFSTEAEHYLWKGDYVQRFSCPVGFCAEYIYSRRYHRYFWLCAHSRVLDYTGLPRRRRCESYISPASGILFILRSCAAPLIV